MCDTVTPDNVRFVPTRTNCPHQELDRTDAAYTYRHTEQVKAMVKAARRDHPDDQGQVKPLHQKKGIYVV